MTWRSWPGAWDSRPKRAAAREAGFWKRWRSIQRRPENCSCGSCNGSDGTVARVTYLESPAAPAATGDTALATLLKRKADLEAQIDALKARKDSLPPEEYDAQLEKLLLELARVAQQIRTKS